jgi:hypothetical protein
MVVPPIVITVDAAQTRCTCRQRQRSPWRTLLCKCCQQALPQARPRRWAPRPSRRHRCPRRARPLALSSGPQWLETAEQGDPAESLAVIRTAIVRRGRKRAALPPEARSRRLSSSSVLAPASLRRPSHLMRREGWPSATEWPSGAPEIPVSPSREHLSSPCSPP